MPTSTIKLKAGRLKKYMRVYNPATEDSPDTWSGQETGNTKVGDIFILFQPAPDGFLDQADNELEIAGVALVYREDAFFPMNYFLDNETYEMSFMEGVLSSRAAEAKEAGKSFYCLRASVLIPLEKAFVTALASMEKKYGGSGERKSDGKTDPLHYFLSCLGIELNSDLEKEILPIGELAMSLWSPLSLPKSSKAPSLRAHFSSIADGDIEAPAAADPEPPPASPAAASSSEEESLPFLEETKPAEPAAKSVFAPEESDAVWEMLKPRRTTSEFLAQQKPADSDADGDAVNAKDKKKKEPAGKEPAEKEQADKDQADKDRAGKERADKDQADKDRADKERADKERAEKELAEKELAEKERAEKERAEKEQAEKEQAEKERAEKERAEKERAEKEQAEKEQAEKEQAEKELAEKELAEKERAEKEQAEKERAEKERAEKERAEKELAEKELAEKDSANKDRTDKEQAEKKEPREESKDRDEKDQAEEGTDESGQPMRKTMSLQATLERLEEQKQKAFNRLEEFKSQHESEVAQALSDLKDSSTKFEHDFIEKLKELRKSVMGKLKLLSIEADQKLSQLVDEGRGKTEQLVPPALADLESARNDEEIKQAIGDLKIAADEFASAYADKLSHILDSDYAKLIEQLAEKELARLSDWESGPLEAFKKASQEISEQAKAQRTAAMANIDALVKSLLERLQTLKELDEKTISKFQIQINETSSNSIQQAESQLKGLCESTLAMQVLPFLSELNNSLGEISNELRSNFADQLEQQSQESLAEFDKLLTMARDTMVETSKSVAGLKTSFEKDGKSKVDKLLEVLSAHLDKKLTEFKDSLKAAEEDRKSGDSPQKRLLKRAEQVRSSSLSTLESSISNLENESTEQIDQTLAAFQSQSESNFAAKIVEVSAEIEAFKKRRQESLQKIDDILKKHTESAEAIAAEFIQ